MIDWRKECEPSFATHRRMQDFGQNMNYCALFALLLSLTQLASPALPPWWFLASVAVGVFAIKWVINKIVYFVLWKRVRGVIKQWEEERLELVEEE